MFSLYSLQVTANDADVDRPNNIIYFLTGPGINAENPSESNFDINKATGEIFVLKVSFKFDVVSWGLSLFLNDVKMYKVFNIKNNKKLLRSF